MTAMSMFLRNTPIKRKLMLVILLTTGFALFLLGSALITYELLTFRRSLVSNMKVLAQVIGANSTGAVAFRDPRSAEEILGALSAERQVTKAAIYDQQGDLFVSYPRAPASEFPSRPRPSGHRFTRTHLSMFQPITQEGSRLGTIYLQADLSQMYSRFAVYGFLLIFVGVAASLGAMALTRTLQQRISVPILELAAVARSISERSDYKVRAVKHDNDEIGQLTEAFNDMLKRISDSSAALSASEERLRLALEGSRTGSWDWNIEADRITWDERQYELFGRTKEQFDGTHDSFMQMVHPDDRPALKEAIERAMADRTPINTDFRIVDLDGTIRHMAARGRVFYDDAGKPVRMSGVNMDVTAEKRSQEELSRAKEAAEAANRAKDDFLAILSHELRTPLTPVLATVAMLEQDETISPSVQRDLAMIRRNIEVESHLIDDLLDVTAIIRGKLELHREVVDVRPMLEHAMENYCAAAAAKKNLRLSMKVTATETFVFADSARMTQVFWNLLQNACKFTPPDGAIDVIVFNEPGPDSNPDLVVQVCDTGAGISAENLSRIFNAFEQGEFSRRRTFGGLGLGLAISRALVTMHGGEISAESDGPDKGACFTVRLRTVPAELSVEKTAASGAGAGAGGEVRRRLRVLLVEDHADTAQQLIRLIERAGHQVTWAGTVAEARQFIASQFDPQARSSFDILISDLGLPDGSGHDLMREVAGRAPIPGIALSGFGMKEDILQSMAAGFSRHITKPVDWQELKQAIEKVGTGDEGPAQV
jgi:PAS domain S-box-containing protein